VKIPSLLSSLPPHPKPIHPRARRSARAVEVKATVGSVTPAADKSKFTRGQVAGRLRQLRLLFEEGLLTDDFHDGKVVECDATQ